MSNYGQTHRSFHNTNYMTSQQTDQERNSSFSFGTPPPYPVRVYILDCVSRHYHEKKEESDSLLKYLKIRTHYAPAKEGVEPEVAADVESSEICAICHSEFEHGETIGILQCGHKYHMVCIQQWLLKKKDCPICRRRASVLPSQEHIF